MPRLEGPGLGLEVKLVVDGRRSPEYADDEPDVSSGAYGPGTWVFHHYVESVSDATFAIHFRFLTGSDLWEKWAMLDRYNGVLLCMDVDGQNDIARVCLRQGERTSRINYITDSSNNTVRKFRFAAVSTVDAASKDRLAKDAEVAKSLGLIRIRAWRVRITRRTTVEGRSRDRRRPASRFDEREEKISVAEKALKGRAISHGTTLSPAVHRVLDHSMRVSTWVDPRNAPLAVVHYKYRSRDALQQELVIPRPRSISDEPDVDNLPDEEVRRLAREYLSERRPTGIKRQASVKIEDGDIPRSSRPLKIMKTEGGNKIQIDLTGDD